MLTLIDGNSLLFRAFYGVHGNLTRRDGVPINAVYGFCNMILPLLAAAKSDDMFICVFDAARKNWRNDIYPNYKANRGETPADLIAQIEMTRGAARAFGMPVLVIDNVEADDVIATLVAHECAMDKTTRIVTGDKDLMQLVSDCCFLYDGMKEKNIRAPEVLEKFGVRPDQVVDIQSLMGDSTDNVPGVPGIGPKTAAELINQFGSLDNLYANLDAVANARRRELLRDNRDSAYISRQLVSLKSDVPLPPFSTAPFVFDFDGAIAFARDVLESPSIENKIKRLFGDHPAPTGHPSDGGELRPSGHEDGSPPQGPRATGRVGWVRRGGREADGVVSGYKLITTESELDAFLATIGDVLAFDTETTGRDPMTATLVGLSLASSDSYGVYIPLRHQSVKTDLFGDADEMNNNFDIEMLRRKLAPIFANPGITKIGHNLKFDLHILENEGWDTDTIAPIDDTMLLSYILFGTAHGHSLDELAEIYLGRANIKFDSLFPPKTADRDKNFAFVAPDAAAEYSAEDSYVCFALYKILRAKLDADETTRKLYENCDRPLLRVLMRVERNGVLVNPNGLRDLSDIFHKQLDELQSEIWRLAGREFNIASPKQLGEILYGEMQLPGPKNKSTDAETLNDIIESHPIVAKILEWRSVAKLAGTYADALPKQIAADGRIHTTYLQTSTNTGRLSSRDPNLQNIPIRTKLGAEIRKCFISAPGNRLISCDYSQIQLRLLAHIANVTELKRAFADNADIHAETARKIFNIPEWQNVPGDLRAAAKTVNFSIIYGVSPFGLANQLNITPPEARAIIDSYMSGFPEISAYMNATREFALERGYVLTPWGRRIELPGIKSPRTRAYALRAAVNAPIQGFEADLMRLAMIRIQAMLSSQFPAAKIIMQVHDEIVIEAPMKIAEAAAKAVEHEMESVAQISVPILADYKIGTEWEK